MSFALVAHLQQKAYTNVAEEAKGDIRGHAGLVLTNDGWMHVSAC
ncbi:hypothetical protein [Achromobacter xylosoxidans]|nr:hypothetical protein [Achromobacter xylosoxidans]UXL04636.1 hypothetical protein N4T34_28005 [Achromobacter xylosoxidans]CUJ13291.1 Uncharacterised protein [Achromobacter xylosoxidans]